MRLRLVLEEAFVAGLAEAGGGVHDGFGEGVVGDAAVGGEVVGVPRLPAWRRAFGADLEQDQIVLASEVPRHRRERFPIEAFVVDAEAAPRRLVLEDLEEQRSDAGARLAGAGVAGDEPAAAEIFARPIEAGEADDDAAASAFAKCAIKSADASQPQDAGRDDEPSCHAHTRRPMRTPDHDAERDEHERVDGAVRSAVRPIGRSCAVRR